MLIEECKLYNSIYQKEYNCKPDINLFNVTSNTLKEEDKLTYEAIAIRVKNVNLKNNKRITNWVYKGLIYRGKCPLII